MFWIVHSSIQQFQAKLEPAYQYFRSEIFFTLITQLRITWWILKKYQGPITTSDQLYHNLWEWELGISFKDSWVILLQTKVQSKF